MINETITNTTSIWDTSIYSAFREASVHGSIDFLILFLIMEALFITYIFLLKKYEGIEYGDPSFVILIVFGKLFIAILAGVFLILPLLGWIIIVGFPLLIIVNYQIAKAITESKPKRGKK